MPKPSQQLANPAPHRPPTPARAIDDLTHQTESLSRTSRDIWGNVTLLPEILPPVVPRLDPKVKDDLATLLVIQLVGQSAWNLATPSIYRDIVVKDWKKLLWLPLTSRSSLPHLKDLRLVRAVARRQTAFGFTKLLTLEQLLPAQAILPLAIHHALTPCPSTNADLCNVSCSHLDLLDMR